jgi:hypothetical protein
MGFGWIFVTDITLDIKFEGVAEHWASSMRAEIMALL